MKKINKLATLFKSSTESTDFDLDGIFSDGLKVPNINLKQEEPKQDPAQPELTDTVFEEESEDELFPLELIPVKKNEPFSKPDPGYKGLKHWDKKKKEKAPKGESSSSDIPDDELLGMSDDQLYQVAASKAKNADQAARLLISRYEERAGSDKEYSLAKKIFENPQTLRHKRRVEVEGVGELDVPILNINRVDSPSEKNFKTLLKWRHALTDASNIMSKDLEKSLQEKAKKEMQQAAPSKGWKNPRSGFNPAQVEVIKKTPREVAESKSEDVFNIPESITNRRRIM